MKGLTTLGDIVRRFEWPLVRKAMEQTAVNGPFTRPKCGFLYLQVAPRQPEKDDESVAAAAMKELEMLMPSAASSSNSNSNSNSSVRTRPKNRWVVLKCNVCTYCMLYIPAPNSSTKHHLIL